jgi:KaiC/GvpD/RAD55 family RecA-like ATPase
MVEPIQRARTGIFGLDELIEGGFPRRRSILVAGSTGTGKTILGMQYLYTGAVEHGEPGVFATFDEMPDKLRQDMLRFGWNVKALEEDNKLGIVDVTSARAGAPSEEARALLPGQLDFDKMLVDILAIARNIGAKRLVIDSIPAMVFHLGEQELRKAILKLSYVVARSGMTTVITTEVPEQPLGGGGALHFSRYGVEEYISDGVILLSFLGVGAQATRTVYIRKMRGTKHSMEIHPMDITDKGMVVRKIEEVFK